jgi:hypothetical protein
VTRLSVLERCRLLSTVSGPQLSLDRPLSEPPSPTSVASCSSRACKGLLGGHEPPAPWSALEGKFPLG